MSLVFCAATTGCKGTISGPAAEEEEAGADAGAGEEEASELRSCVPASGSRLKQVLHRYDDGSEVFVGHHDSELDVDCEFRAGFDDSLRCVPRDPELALSASLRHVDPNCTQRLAQLAPSQVPAGAPRFATLSAPTSTTCDQVMWVARLGAARAYAPTDTVYAIQDGVCVARTVGTSRYYDIASLLDPTEMVGATESWVGGERMEMVQIDGADGSRACNSMLLRDRSMDMMSCTLHSGADAIRCLPSASMPASSAYSDAECSVGTTVGISYDTCDLERRYAIDSPSSDTCTDSSPIRIYRLAGQMSGQQYAEAGDQCYALGSTSTVYEVEQELPVASFAQLVRAWQPLGERLERGDLASEDGLRFHRTMIRDASFGASCSLEVAGDGQTRCVPRTSPAEPLLSVVTRYTDAECTAPVQVATRPFAICYDETPAFAAGTVDDKAQVFAVGAAVATPLYTRVTDTYCDPAAADEHFALGEAAAPETFLAGQKVIEE